MRLHYFVGRCQDCGRERNVTTIMFWVNGYTMRVCGECIRPYRDRILKHGPGCLTGCPVHRPSHRQRVQSWDATSKA